MAADHLAYKEEFHRSLQGHWKSVSPEAMGGFWATREFVIDAERWSVQFRTYGEAEPESSLLFTLSVGGFYVLGGPSTKVDGAYEGIFPALHRDILVESSLGALFFSKMGLPWTAGEKRSLVSESAGFVPSLMEGMGEYDLVAINDGNLFFGDRSGDLTKQRPERLTPFALQRLS